MNGIGLASLYQLYRCARTFPNADETAKCLVANRFEALTSDRNPHLLLLLLPPLLSRGEQVVVGK